MTYQEFISEAIYKRLNKDINKDDMQFAYIFFHQQVGESVEEALDSVRVLNEFQYES